MNPEVKKLWVDALRSGEYIQGKGLLRINDTFCCFGVLCDLHRKDQLHKKARLLNSQQWSNDGGYLNTYGDLPHTVLVWAGLDNERAYSQRVDVTFDGRSTDLVYLNDRLNLNFNKIADVIEECL